MNDPEAPALQEGLLARPLFERYLAELERYASIHALQLKAAPGAHSHSGPTALSAAAEALQTGRTRGVQITYRHDGRDWLDTVLPAAAGWRIIRMELR